MSKKPSLRSAEFYQHIISLIDNMERAADSGLSIRYEISRLLGLIDSYGYHKALEARINAGFPPLVGEDDETV